MCSLRTRSRCLAQTPHQLLPACSLRAFASVVILLALTIVAPRQATCTDPAGNGRTVRSDASPLGKLVVVEELHTAPTWNYVITPGMGGMKVGDRFYLLAETIRKTCPTANVFLVDWNDAANQRVWGVNIPHLVAKSINPVARDIAEELPTRGINPATLTLIGESFGNCVNHRVAQRIGGVNRMLAFNPANELGGYPLPHLERFSVVAWAFHTRSPFDTCAKLGDRGVLLQVASDDPFFQHTYGVQWLRQRLTVGDDSWLKLQRDIPKASSEQFFDLVVDKDGNLILEEAIRVPPSAETNTAEANNAEPNVAEVQIAGANMIASRNSVVVD